MRIDELDPKHKDFKKIILDHDLTEEQLDEILPAIAAVGGGLARGAMAVGQVAARGAMAAGNAVARGAQAVGRGAASLARGVGRGANQLAQRAGQKAGQMGRNLATDTAKKLSQPSQGTIGTTGTQNQASLQRGQEITIPTTDPKNPKKSTMTPMKVKGVTGSEVELQPKKKKPGEPSTIKFKKSDLAF